MVLSYKRYKLVQGLFYDLEECFVAPGYEEEVLQQYYAAYREWADSDD